MFELIIFGVILLAATYWTTLFIMGRRNDVIHGSFVLDEEQSVPLPIDASARPPFPQRPYRTEPIAKRVDSEALQSLLNAIQRDLKNVA
jgi:hypothetical protein